MKKRKFKLSLGFSTIANLSFSGGACNAAATEGGQSCNGPSCYFNCTMWGKGCGGW